MPNGDYTEPTVEQEESRHICQHIEYVYKYVNKTLPNWVYETARDDYGNAGKLKQAKEMLVRALRSLMGSEVEAIVYDSHKRDSRSLANWWERYLKEEKRENAEKKAERKKASLKDSALKKLTSAEVEALDLDKACHVFPWKKESDD